MNLHSVVIRKIFFPMMKYFKGNRTIQYIEQLNQSQYYSKEKLKKYQEKRLKKLLLHCVENIPAYKDYKHLIPIIKKEPLKALENFPILNKQQVNKLQDQLTDPSIDKETLVLNRSGGSTGEPTRFYLDRPTIERSEAARWRGLSWWNIHMGDPCVMIWGNPLELNKNQKLIYNLKERLLKNNTFVSAFDLNPQSISNYMAKFNKRKPMYFYGYASSLYLFAQLVLKSKLRLNYTPKGIVSTSETLYDFQRKTIEGAFGCNVINEYGARDAGILAYECTQGNMHITTENTILEIVDIDTKKPVEPGTSGLIITTDLSNFSMPRIRYELGDIATLSPKTCTCGMTLPVIEQLEGREDDIFVTTTGNYVHGVCFGNIARNYTSIKQFQIIQKTPTDVLLKIIKDEPFNEEEIKFFLEEIKKILGEVSVTIKYVETISPSASGKIRYSKRDFPLTL